MNGWSKENTAGGKWEVFKQGYRTEARWDKSIQHLNKLAQQPFSSAELWKLHQHYFTPVVNESGGSVAPSPNPSTEPVGMTVWSVPEVSRGSCSKPD